jgi:hypothetical protein
MIKLEMKWDESKGSRQQIEIAAQRALLKTAQAIQAAEQTEMGRVFDRPTRWTLGAMKVRVDSKFAVTVGILDPDGFYKRAQNYLSTQVDGGTRRLKAMEVALQRRGIMPTGWVAVPGSGAEQDQYGNVAVGQLRQILSWFDAAERWAGSTQNMGEKGRAKRRKGTRSKRGFEYFHVYPGRSHQGHRQALHPGIYKRTSFVFGKAIKPVLLFVRAAGYKPRFGFEQVAIDTYEREFPAQFDAAMQRDPGASDA